MEELYKGDVGFEERFSLIGGANLKNFAGSVPNEALGIGRVTIDFVDQPVRPAVEMAAIERYWDRANKVLKGSNGQMVWDYSARGYLTVDTEAGCAAIGFGGGKTHDLAGASIRYGNPFANMYVVAREPGATLATAKEWVILTLARTANEGDVLEETSIKELEPAPRRQLPNKQKDRRNFLAENPRLLAEPVRADFLVKRNDPCKVFALDHDGVLPSGAEPLAAQRGKTGTKVILDGAKTKAVYYLVRFEKAD
jgi:hypothetical protein